MKKNKGKKILVDATLISRTLWSWAFGTIAIGSVKLFVGQFQRSCSGHKKKKEQEQHDEQKKTTTR